MRRCLPHLFLSLQGAAEHGLQKIPEPIKEATALFYGEEGQTRPTHAATGQLGAGKGKEVGQPEPWSPKSMPPPPKTVRAPIPAMQQQHKRGVRSHCLSRP